MAAPRSPRTLVDAGKDRLQPALLDRLTDEAPTADKERVEAVFVTESRLRAALLRDLGWLLNANNAHGVIDFQGLPQAERSVLNYGVPPMSGQLLSELDWPALENGIRRAIIDFEPRILPATLEVTQVAAESTLASHNTLQFEIRCQFWSLPYPIEMLLKSSLDLESGQVAMQSS